MSVSFLVRQQVDADAVRAIRELLDAATDHDGVSPVSEHVLLHLRHGGGNAYNVLAVEAASADGGCGPGLPGRLIGYAHVDITDRRPSAELAVHPAYRRCGVGTGVIEALERISDEAPADGRLRVWAHGRHPGAVALADRLGYVEDRALWQMRRSLRSPLPEPVLPAGVRIRPFVVGQDEPAWVEVNNRAFASHPEQGGWTVDDVRIREHEPWFDPEGFLLAERESDRAIVGFHWTKVHGGGQTEPVGEVYVVGVDPAAQGQRLGEALTLAGLHHLRARGLSRVMLYVDESNTAAVRLYTRLGFTRSRVDVQYGRPPRP